MSGLFKCKLNHFSKGGNLTQKSNILSLVQNPETSQIETREVKLGVPKWGWLFLQARANAVHGGDLDQAIKEVFNSGLVAFVEMSEIDMEPVNLLPC
jgi:hypothetical protein